MKVAVCFLPFTSAVRVTDLPLCSASTRFSIVSCEQARSPTCVEIRCTTAGPCASSCCTKVVTCVSDCVVAVDENVFCAVDCWLLKDPAEALPGCVVEYVFWLDCVFGVEVEPNVAFVSVVVFVLALAEPLNEPAALALPVAFMAPVLFWKPVFEDGVVLVLPVADEFGVVDCMSLVPPNWPAEDVLVVGVVCDPLELKLEDFAFEAEFDWVALEELDVWACRPRVATRSAVAPQVISLWAFFMFAFRLRVIAGTGCIRRPAPVAKTPAPHPRSRSAQSLGEIRIREPAAIRTLCIRKGATGAASADDARRDCGCDCERLRYPRTPTPPRRT